MNNRKLWQKLGFNVLISTILFGIFFGILFLLEYYIPELHNKLLNFDDIAFNIGIVASIAGVGYTLTIRNPKNFIGFYLGIVMSLLLGIQFLLKDFYDLTFLYIVVFIPFQITSIITWKNGLNNVKSEPTFLPPTKRFLTIFVFLLLIICDYFFASYVINQNSIWQNSFAKIINGIVIASSILANFWLIFKKIDAWIYWIIYSVASVIQGIFVINNPFNAILSLFFIVINALASYSWIKNYKNASK